MEIKTLAAIGIMLGTFIAIIAISIAISKVAQIIKKWKCKNADRKFVKLLDRATDIIVIFIFLALLFITLASYFMWIYSNI